MTLLPGQYQLGDLVMGKHTNIIVTNFEAQPYDVNAQDYQISRSDEMRFGSDHFKPTSVQMTMEVIYNKLLEPFAASDPNFWSDKPTVNDIAEEWRANDVRNSWGQIKPLYYCGRDEITKMIFGRPGQFSAEKVSENSTVVKCIGEFRRADTIVYESTETYISMTGSSNVARQNGNTDTWCRILVYGPATNPAFNIAGKTIQVNASIGSGVTMEISTYPWARRIVTSTGINLRNALSVSSDYLDQIKLPMGLVPAQIISGASSANFVWRDAWSAVE